MAVNHSVHIKVLHFSSHFFKGIHCVQVCQGHYPFIKQDVTQRRGGKEQENKRGKTAKLDQISSPHVPIFKCGILRWPIATVELQQEVASLRAENKQQKRKLEVLCCCKIKYCDKVYPDSVLFDILVNLPWYGGRCDIVWFSYLR